MIVCLKYLDNNKLMPTHNIANGGDGSNFRHYSPPQTFSTVDKVALRKPPLAILSTVVHNCSKRPSPQK
jgi:hypothetical protein